MIVIELLLGLTVQFGIKFDIRIDTINLHLYFWYSFDEITEAYISISFLIFILHNSFSKPVKLH